MKKYEFNRNEFNWAEDFYNLIQERMGLPEWFGKNEDALWDMLTGYIKLPCEISFIGFNKKENKYNQAKINSIVNCFLDASKEYPEDFKIIIK